MAPIIRICNRQLLRSVAVWAVAAPILVSAPSAFAGVEKPGELDRYVDARLSEFADEDGVALKDYLRLIKDGTQSPVLSNRIYTTAIRVGDMKNAAISAREQFSTGQHDDEAVLILFTDAMRQKNWTAARKIVDDLDDGNNFQFLAPIYRSWINVAEGRAPALPTEDIDTNPIYAYYAYDQRIYMDLATRQYARAAAGIAQLAGVQEDFARDLAIRAAPIFAANGQSALAEKLLSGQIERDYAAALVRTRKGDDLASLGVDEGLAALHIRLARALLMQENGELALVFARLAQWSAPENNVVRLVLAQSLADQKLNAQASIELGKIPETSPNWVRAVSDQVALSLSTGNNIAAVKLATSAQKARPNSANLALVLARAHEQTGNLNIAVKIYEQLVREGDNARVPAMQRAQYRMFLAVALHQSGDWDTARKRLEEAREIDPRNATILNYLGYSLLERGEDRVLGLELVRKAYIISPDSPAIADSLGWGYFLAGDYEKAVMLLEKAVQKSDNDPEINEHMGDAYWVSGRFVDARYAWRIAAHMAGETGAKRLAHKIDVGLPPDATNP